MSRTTAEITRNIVKRDRARIYSTAILTPITPEERQAIKDAMDHKGLVQHQTKGTYFVDSSGWNHPLVGNFGAVIMLIEHIQDDIDTVPEMIPFDLERYKSFLKKEKFPYKKIKKNISEYTYCATLKRDLFQCVANFYNQTKEGQLELMRIADHYEFEYKVPFLPCGIFEKEMVND